MEVKLASKNHQHRGLGRSRFVFFLRCCRVLKRYVFEWIFGSAKVSNKSQMAAVLADDLILAAIFARGRRERRCAGEEKEEGLLRTADCVFKN